jgi:hypothetical protein
MTRQAARAEARKLSKLWVSTRLRGPKKLRQELVSQLTSANWKAIKVRHENSLLYK